MYQPPQAPSQTKKRQQPEKPRLFRRLAFVCLFLALAAALVLGAIAGSKLIEQERARAALEAEVKAVENVFLPNIYVDGIHLGGMTAQEGIDAVLEQMHNRQDRWAVRLTYRGHVFITLNYSTLGVRPDDAQAYALLRELFAMGKTGTMEERKQVMDDMAQTTYNAYTTQSAVSDQQLDAILSQIKEQVTREPTDAYVAYFYPDLPDPFIIQNEIYGSTLDTDALKQQVLAMAGEGKSGDIEVTPVPVNPKVTAADIRRQVTLLCRVTTPVSSTSTYDRTSNIRTALSRVNGQKVDPGKKFSFNSVTLARKLDNGYKYAIEYQTGMEVMGIGGGVCQASTTVYLAALQSGMEILNRTSHSDPVSYTTFGQDATVVYGRLDLVFRNPYDSPVYITAHVNEVKKNKFETEVCIYGPTLGDGVYYTLNTITVETTEAPLNPTYQQDTAHTYVTYKDEEPYLVRKARDGFVNETYLQRWENGVVVSEKFVSRDTCKPRGEVYYVGTVDPELRPPE